MNKKLRAVAVFLALSAAFVFSAVPGARAQFAAQQTYASSSTGAANAFVVTIPNVNQSDDLVGVPLHVLMSASNSGAATLSISNGSTTVIAATSIEKLTTSGLASLVGNEIRQSQISTFMWDGTQFELLSPTLPLTTTQTQNGFSPATNLQISATVNSNQLTISLLAADSGAAPDVAHPVLVPFRDTTIANGDPVWRTITSASSFTIGSGSTMGCLSGKMCRLWVVGMDNGGTVQVCAFNALSGYNVAFINEGTLQSSASGTSGGSLAHTYYCNASSLTNVAVRILGYVEIQETIAGTWSTAPTFVQLFGPGVKKPGDIVQTLVATTNTPGGTTSSSFAELSPAITADFAAASAADPIRIFVSGAVQTNNGGQLGEMEIVRDSLSTVIGYPASAPVSGTASNQLGQINIMGYDLPNDTSTHTYSLAGKISGGATLSYPVSGFGSVFEIQEIMG